MSTALPNMALFDMVMVLRSMPSIELSEGALFSLDFLSVLPLSLNSLLAPGGLGAGLALLSADKLLPGVFDKESE